MKRWIKVLVVEISIIVVLFALLTAHIYFMVDNRVKLTAVSDNVSNNISILRLDSSVVSPDSITAHVEQVMRRSGVTGLGISIINHGEIVYQHYFGKRNGPKDENFLPGTIMYGASFSKTLLADVALQMSEQGLLHLDSPLYRYLDKPLAEFRTSTISQFFGANYYDYSDLSGDDRSKQITARMCLSHTTGLPNWRWLEPDRKLKFKFTPGDHYSYSGEGMFLLQMVMEEISGKDFEELAIERVFNPLSLQRSSFVWQRSYEGNYAIGHDTYGNFVGIRKTNVPNGAGSLSTTLEEYTIYFKRVLSQSEPRYRVMTTRCVSIPFRQQFGKEALIETHDNDSIQLGYGLGWGVFETPFGHAFFKEGHDDGTANYALCISERRDCILLMSNSTHAEAIFVALLHRLLGEVGLPAEWEGYGPD